MCGTGWGSRCCCTCSRWRRRGSPASDTPSCPAGVLYHPARDVILKADRDITPEKLRSGHASGSCGATGMVLGDPEVLRAMEHSALEAPCYLPIQREQGRRHQRRRGLRRRSWGGWGSMWSNCCTRSPGRCGSGNIDADPCWPVGRRTAPAPTATLPRPVSFQDGQAGDRLRC